MKKILLPGLLAGVINLALGMGISYLFMMIPSINADYNNPALIRPFEDPLMMVFFLYPFLLAIILAWVWSKAKTLFTGTTFKKGLKFGLSVFLVLTIPGMFVTYTCFPLSILTVLSWAADGLVSALVAGMIFAKLNK
jgi:hypothetical protein